MKKKVRSYKIVPDEILENKNISDGAKLMYIQLLNLSKRDQDDAGYYCKVKNNYFVKRNIKKNEREVSRNLAELENQKLINIKNRSNQYRQIYPMIFVDKRKIKHNEILLKKKFAEFYGLNNFDVNFYFLQSDKPAKIAGLLLTENRTEKQDELLRTIIEEWRFEKKRIEENGS